MMFTPKVYPFEEVKTWVERVQDLMYQPMDQMLESLAKSYIHQMDDEDFRFRQSDADRTFAKMLCYSIIAQIEFRRELSIYIRRYGELDGRQTLENIYRAKYPLIDFSTL